MFKRLLFRHSWITLVVCAALGGATTLYAIDTSSALYTSNIQLLNLGLTRANFAAATEISGSALIDDAFMEPDTLNAVVHEGPVEIPSMPPNNRIVVEGSVVDDGGSFTEFTTEARDDTELDVALLPVTPEVGDAHYFGCDNPCRIITVDIGQEAIADTLEVEWEYWNGTAFVTSSNVNDATNAFTLAGQRTVSFDMPRDFATRTITGSAVDAFWVRARVTDVDNPTQQAIGNQMWYENGQWWSWVRSQAINDEVLYNLSLGGPDLVTNHQIFPGDAGVITPDDASAELGSTYAIHWDGALDFTSQGSTVCVLCKPGALRLYVSDTATNELTLDVTGSGTTSLSLSGIPDATLTSTGVTPHIIDIVSDGTDLTFAVDGVGSVTGTAQDVTDNSNDWEWMANNAATFGNRMYLMPDETSLASESFDSEADWDGGTLTDVVSTGGQPSATQQYLSINSADDGFWQEGNSSFFNSLNVTRFGFTDGTTTRTNAFYRFEEVRVDQGATIDSASLVFTPATSNSNTTVNVDIAAIDEDSASAPGTFTAAEGATRTAAVVDWNNVPAFAVGTLETSPDIASVIQEIVNRPGWTSGNSIVIYVEDDGSTASSNTFRQACTFEAECEAVRLEIDVDDGLTLTDDFIEQEATAQDTDNDGFIEGWNHGCAGTGCISRVFGLDQGTSNSKARYNGNSLRLRAGTSVGTSAAADQDLTASAGEVWSFQADIARTISDNDSASMVITFRDASFSVLATHTASIGVDSSSYQTFAIDGVTAPANTELVRVRFEVNCASSCSNASGIWIDGVVGCVCNPSPNFPDASNVVVNPSFEQIFQTEGTWLSPTISLNQSEVVSSSINWDELLPFDADITVETSLSGGPFLTATNGEPIPGISAGDDVSGETLRIRVTMTPSTGDAQIFSSAMTLLSVIITDDILEDDAILFYELRTTPGVTIEDLSPNSNDGTMSYPVQFAGIFSAITPLRSNRTPISQEAALGVGDFAGSAPVTGSDSLNLFGQDDGTFIPGAQPIVDAMNDLGAPVAFFWVMLISALGIVFGAMVWKGTNGNEMAVSLVLGATLVLAAAMGDGLIPGWVPIVSIMMLVAWNILRSRLPI